MSSCATARARTVDWPYLSAAALLVVAPVVWAAYNILGRGLPAGRAPSTPRWPCSSWGAHRFLFLADRHTVDVLAASPAALAAALYLAVPCTLVGFTAWLWALKRLPAARWRSPLPESAPRQRVVVPFRGHGAPLAFLVGGLILLLVGVGLVVFAGSGVSARRTPPVLR